MNWAFAGSEALRREENCFKYDMHDKRKANCRSKSATFATTVPTLHAKVERINRPWHALIWLSPKSRYFIAPNFIPLALRADGTVVYLYASSSLSQWLSKMPKIGSIVAIAGVLLLAAVGAYLYPIVVGTTNNPVQVSESSKLPLAAEGPSIERQLVDQMSQIAGSNGYVVTFSDADVKRWRIPEGHQVERFSINNGDAAFVRLTSRAPISKEGWKFETQGLSWLIPKDFNDRTNGGSVEIGIVARRSGTNSSGGMSLLYATRGYGNSGWKTFPLSSKFQLKKFTYDFPRVEGVNLIEPILVITADFAGTGKSIEILGVYVKPVE
ncbi:MAG: hypothetical protein ABL973_16410 [Micropepsaceae bacterium]